MQATVIVSRTVPTRATAKWIFILVVLLQGLQHAAKGDTSSFVESIQHVPYIEAV